MANIQSQIKRNRQNDARRRRNKTVRSSMKTSLRKFERAVSEGDAPTASEAFLTAARQLDKAAQKGVVHHNYAAGRKSKMAKRLAALS